MLALFETPAGFALFKVLDEEKLSKVEVKAKLFFSFMILQVVQLGVFYWVYVICGEKILRKRRENIIS